MQSEGRSVNAAGARSLGFQLRSGNRSQMINLGVDSEEVVCMGPSFEILASEAKEKNQKGNLREWQDQRTCFWKPASGEEELVLIARER